MEINTKDLKNGEAAIIALDFVRKVLELETSTPDKSESQANELLDSYTADELLRLFGCVQMLQRELLPNISQLLAVALVAKDPTVQEIASQLSGLLGLRK